MDEVFNLESEGNFLQVVNEILNNLCHEQNKPMQLLRESLIETAKDELRDIIFKTDCTAETVFELLISKGFHTGRSKLISSLIENRKNELLYATLVNYNSTHGATATKFDWAVKLVYGTSELKKLRYPLLQLTVTTLTNGHRQQQMYDIDEDMLENMIRILECIST